MCHPRHLASMAILSALGAALLGCASGPMSAHRGGPSAEPAPPAAPVGAPPPREGVLVAYVGGQEIGRERFRDDGETFSSELVLAGARSTVAIDRAARHVTVEAGEQRVERDYAVGTLVLENGSWQSYAMVLERYAEATEPTAVRVLVPGPGATLDGTVQVTDGADGARRIEVTLGEARIIAEVLDGVVRRLTIPSQGVEVLPEGVEPSRRAARETPDEVREEAFEVTRADVALRGVLWLPAAAEGPVPLVVLIAGSGPTDRDCNQAVGLHSDAFWLIAEGLAREGIASLRYDKRGVGESGTNFVAAETVFDDFVEDALAIVERVRGDARFSGVTLAGHSEGGLVALRVAERVPVSGLVLLATAGRPMAALLREQLARQLDTETMAEVDRVLAELRAGGAPRDVPEILSTLFHPSVQTFLRSVMDVDPAPLVRAVRVPVTIIQGETDAQVSVSDARLLARAQRRARLVLVPRANHVLKEEASIALPQASYTDPERPIVPAVLEALVAASR